MMQASLEGLSLLRGLPFSTMIVCGHCPLVALITKEDMQQVMGLIKAGVSVCWVRSSCDFINRKILEIAIKRSRLIPTFAPY